MINSVKNNEKNLVGKKFSLILFKSLSDFDKRNISSINEENETLFKDDLVCLFYDKDIDSRELIESIEQTLLVEPIKVYTDRFVNFNMFMFSLESFSSLEEGFDKYGSVLELISDIDEKYKRNVLKDYYDDVDIKEIILMYVKCNMNVIKTAEMLGLHRNTINNKINKIKEVTGYNPNDFEDLMILYLTIL